MTKNIIIIILILAFIGVIVFLDVPGVQGVLDLRREIQIEEQKFSDKQELLIKMEELNQVYEENLEGAGKVAYIIPSGKDLPNLIVQLESVVFGSGLVLEEINFSETSSDQSEGQTKPVNYKILSVSLRLIGSYASFEGFLQTIEENMRLLDIMSIEFSPQTEGTDLFNFDVEIRGYYQ
jgi:Tfp pilus assembly protein PilO